MGGEGRCAMKALEGWGQGCVGLGHQSPAQPARLPTPYTLSLSALFLPWTCSPLTSEIRPVIGGGRKRRGRQTEPSISPPLIYDAYKIQAKQVKVFSSFFRGWVGREGRKCSSSGHVWSYASFSRERFLTISERQTSSPRFHSVYNYDDDDARLYSNIAAWNINTFSDKEYPIN